MSRIEIHPEADREIEEAFEWYFSRSAKAAESFLLEIDKAISAIEFGPQAWPMFESGARSFFLSKFPYNIVYRELDDRIQLVAVAHQKRRPGYWVSRMKD
jgi:plasmid stabilization system protein ParE